MTLTELIARVAVARRNAHELLAAHESAPSRVILLEDLTKRLAGVPIDVYDYFHEAIKCLQFGLYRSAIVTAWAGQLYIMVETMLRLHEAELRSKRSKWVFDDATQLRENHPEAQLLIAAKEIGLFGKAKLRILDGHLSTRNQCAHPTLYRPSLNSAIGYVDDMIVQTLRYLA